VISHDLDERDANGTTHLEVLELCKPFRKARGTDALQAVT
jgi:hypothetical protein